MSDICAACGSPCITQVLNDRCQQIGCEVCMPAESGRRLHALLAHWKQQEDDARAGNPWPDTYYIVDGKPQREKPV